MGVGSHRTVGILIHTEAFPPTRRSDVSHAAEERSDGERERSGCHAALSADELRAVRQTHDLPPTAGGRWNRRLLGHHRWHAVREASGRWRTKRYITHHENCFETKASKEAMDARSHGYRKAPSGSRRNVGSEGGKLNSWTGAMSIRTAPSSAIVLSNGRRIRKVRWKKLRLSSPRNLCVRSQPCRCHMLVKQAEWCESAGT